MHGHASLMVPALINRGTSAAGMQPKSLAYVLANQAILLMKHSQVWGTFHTVDYINCY